MNKIAIINRAVVGSGKSTMAKAIATILKENGLSVAIHSTDELFMIDGKYCYDFSKIASNHAQNLQNFTDSVKNCVSCVICDNTNIKLTDVNNYFNVASEYGYHVIVLNFVPSSIEEHNSRNVHNVPIEVIGNMRTNLLQSFQDYKFNDEIYVQPEEFVDKLIEIPLEILRMLEHKS